MESLKRNGGNFAPDYAGNLRLAVTTKWAVFDALVAARDKILRDRYTNISELLDLWDQSLEAFGGDPTHTDWRRFRPFKRSREEDWSDWLASLIETSSDGRFSYELFGDSKSTLGDYAHPNRVEREVASGGYRADLIVHWTSDRFSHIEVKVGDPNLRKTYATGKVMRARYGVPMDKWTNYVLLLSEQIAAWEGIEHHSRDEPPTTALTWENACVALRRAVIDEGNIKWKAWAYVYLGAIEQFLVGYTSHGHGFQNTMSLEAKIRILQEGISHV